MGFKFNKLTTIRWFILIDCVITPANIDDRNVICDFYKKYNSISIIDDKVYVNKRLTLELKLKNNINLLFLKRGIVKKTIQKK